GFIALARRCLGPAVVPPGQHVLERENLAAAKRQVAGKLAQRRLPSRRGQHLAQGRDERLVQVLLKRREEVALLRERNEVEALGPRRGLDPERGVGAAAGDALRDGAVRRLDAVVAG